MNVYFDNAATTPISKKVLDKMIPYMEDGFGNPSSIHKRGREIKSVIEKSRSKVADILSCEPGEIFFTSGGTEADNMFIINTVLEKKIDTVITSKVEHHAVLHCCDYLNKTQNINIKYVSINDNGEVDLDDLEKITSNNKNSLVSLMHGNNEIGNINDLKTISKICEKNNVVFVEGPNEIPEGAIVMLSAHGTAPEIELQFNNISSLTINSVCPLVTKVHHEAKKFSKENTQIIYVGHKNHDEAKGAIGVSPENMHLVESIEDVKALEIGNDVALLAQTTLALSEWEPIMKYSQERFNGLKMPRKSDLCYATTNRQETILEILPEVNTVLVVGSENSSNTKALVSMVNNQGVEAYRVDNVNDIENLNLN